VLNYELLTDAVDRAASIATSKFPAHHDVRDVKQTLWVWIMENKNTVSELVEKSEGSDQLLVDLMTKAALSYLKKEDAATYGYDEEDVFTYSVDLIKSILEVVFKHEDWQSLSQAIGDGLPRQRSEPATAGDNLASYADVSRVVSELPEEHYNLILWRYKYELTWNQVGEELGITRQAAQQRHETALKALQRALGQGSLADLRGGYDGRTQDALTRGNLGRSETAQHVVERDYEG
jgi:RNA polymerase sigma factor (sigma-70 family)